MPVIFGHEVDKRTLWIGGGLMAVAIAVVVFLRAKAGAAANEEAGAPSQPQPDQGYGMSIGAPTGAVADGYQQQIDTAEEQAKVIANKYQSNLVQQQQTQFDFEQRQREQLAPDILANERSQLAVETHYNKTKANTRVSCPKGSGKALGPDGEMYCRQKSSGLPVVTDLIRTAHGLVYGAAAAAPSIGYDAAKAAAQYYMGKTFPTTAVVRARGSQSTPPIAANGQLPTVEIHQGYGLEGV
jgi:hypothetical protein